MAEAPQRRLLLVQRLREEGIRDERVLGAFAAVPREMFVPADQRHQAYEDFALEIGEGQTISAPSVVARITELAEVSPRDRVLEIGAGSGYQAAILSLLARFVFAVERIPALAEGARRRLAELGIANATIQVMDGSLGWRAQAPFDAIVVSAGAPVIPTTLVEQLSEGGRLVIPVGARDEQVLVRVVRGVGENVETRHGAVRFVPLVGRHGFARGA